MAAKKKRRTNKAAAPQTPYDPNTGLIVIPEAPEPDDDTVTVDPVTGAVSVDNEDGSITIDPTGMSLWQQPDEDDDSFHQNLARKIDPIELARIAEDVMMGVDADKQDRSQWMQMRAKCLDLLGLKLEDPKGDVSRSALGMATSVVKDPTMLQAVNMFRANTFGELCPSSGPVKVKITSSEETSVTQEDADALQADLNTYLTTTASEYYPDMYYMLWWTGLTSGTFKKVYECPLRQRPVSEYIDGTKLIVSDATDLKNAPRITHEIEMDRATLRAMQLAGVYLDMPLSDPMPPQRNIVDEKKAAIAGMGNQPQRIEDQKFTLFETYCKLDVQGFEHKMDGKLSGLPVPYRVTIDTTSRQVLEIRRNWDEEDEGKVFLPPDIPFVAFPFSTGLLRTYGTGLGHEMGNMASALTALLRICIDAGILGNYPGAIKAKGPGRDLVNEIMVPPGGVAEIDTGGMPIQQFFMSLPYKGVAPETINLIQQTRGAAKELGGTANLPVAEGKQDAPVGTTLAMIEQALKPLSATHRMLCSAQAEEFRLLVKLFRRHPDALWRHNKKPALGQDQALRAEKFKRALNDCNIEPVADPNVPSEMHRKLLTMALKQLTMGNPAYDQVKIDRWIAKMMLKMPEADFDQFLLPPQPGQPNPAQILAQIEAAKIQVQQQKVQLDAQKAQWQAQNAKAERESREQIEAAKIAFGQKPEAQPQAPPPDPFKAAQLALEQRAQQLDEMKAYLESQNKAQDRDAKLAVEAMKIANTIGIHPEANALVDEQLNQMAPLIEPATKKPDGAADGGSVDSPEAHPADLLNEAAPALDLAFRIRRIRDALEQERPGATDLLQ